MFRPAVALGLSNVALKIIVTRRNTAEQIPFIIEELNIWSLLLNAEGIFRETHVT
jgi:hypothetical protein